MKQFLRFLLYRKKPGLRRRIIAPLLLCVSCAVLSIYLSACCSDVGPIIPAAELERILPPTEAAETVGIPSQPQNTEDGAIASSAAPTEPERIYAVWDESSYQNGAPISPQPGDTQAAWQPDMAEIFPADRDCNEMELLEKWMAVEGLTPEDLDARECNQLVLVAAQEPDGIQTETVCYQREADGAWQAVTGLSGMHGWVGGNGIMHGRKRGSDTSPAGLWSLGLAFGNSPKPAGLKMPWRDVTPNSDWVCDEASIYFNSWQERGDPSVLDMWSDDVEHLEDYQSAYAYACVIRFNTAPYTIAERGCAIFFHCSKGATGGCIGLPESDVVNTLLWLDPQENPYILITGYQCRTEN